MSRGDLIRSLACEPLQPAGAARAEGDLVREFKARLAAEPWAKAHGIVAQAEKGVLGLWGFVDSEAEKSAVETLARAIAGVTSVENHLVVRQDAPYLYWV